MSVLYERIEGLCLNKGITGYRLCKDIGVSPNLITELRTGRRDGVSAKTLALIAKYFGVSSDYLLGSDNAPEGDAAEMLQSLRDEDRALLEVARNMTPEQVRIMMEFGKSIKEINNAD